MNYSEEQLVDLAKSDPEELARLLINPSTNTVALTFGAEIIASEVSDENIVLPVLKRLLRHINALVREGAIIGVGAFYNDRNPPKEILEKLKDLSNIDPSKAIKSVAKDLLENYSE